MNDDSVRFGGTPFSHLYRCERCGLDMDPEAAQHVPEDCITALRDVLCSREHLLEQTRKELRLVRQCLDEDEIKLAEAEINIALLRDALESACNSLVEFFGLLDHWASYADDYYKKKWNFEGDRAKIAAAIQAATAALDGASAGR